MPGAFDPEPYPENFKMKKRLILKYYNQQQFIRKESYLDKTGTMAHWNFRDNDKINNL